MFVFKFVLFLKSACKFSGIYLNSNNITELPYGIFDPLPKLKNLDLVNNPFLDEIVTKAWYFCHEQDFGQLVVSVRQYFSCRNDLVLVKSTFFVG